MNNIKTNVLFFVLMALIFMAYVALIILHPAELIEWFGNHYALNQEKAGLLGQYIQEAKLTMVKWLLSLLFLSLLLVFFFDRNILKEYRLSFSSFLLYLKNDFKTNSAKERLIVTWLIFSFAGLIIGYHLITPFQLDELHTWLFFVNRGVFVTAAYYPSSNNHIAYNLLSIVWNVLLSPIWAIRIVSILSSIGTVTIFFMVLRKRYTIVFSIVGMLLLMCSAPFMWYAVQGRGYVLELFILVVTIYILIQPLYSFATDRLLVLCNVSAVYVLPVAIIPLAVLNVYYMFRLVKERQYSMPRVLKTFIYSAVLIFLCYTPVLIFSGEQQLFNNAFVQRITYQETLKIGLTTYLPNLWDFISGCHAILSLVIFVLLIGGTVLLLSRKKNKAVLPFVILCIPFIILQFYPVLLFERTWLWLIVPFVWWVIEVTSSFICLTKKWTMVLSWLFISLIVGSNLLRSFQTHQLLKEHADQFLKLKQAIAVHVQGKTLRVNDDVTYDYLLYDQILDKKYDLIYSNQQPALKANMVLCNDRSFNPALGKLLWTNHKETLYKPK